MSTTLTVIGCSGSAPGPDAACSCYLVESADFRLLLDIGTGAAGPLQRFLRADEIDAVFVSHGHGDHNHDLRALNYLRARAGTRRPLPVFGPPDVADQVQPMGGTIGPWSVRTALGQHHRENWAVRLDDRLCYTGDTAPCPAVDDLADGCAVLLAEASGFDGDRPPNHLSAADAGRIAARSGTRLLILTHVRPWHDPRELLAEAADHCDCPVLLARPGLRVTLRK